MMKLVGYLSSKKQKKDVPVEVAKPTFSRREKEEIRMTLNKVQGSEMHEILMKQLAMADLVAELDAKNEEDQSADEGSYDSGTFCMKDLKSSSASTTEDDSSYSSDTFCFRTASGGSDATDEDSEGGGDFGTFCMRSDSSSEVKKKKSSLKKKGKKSSSSAAVVIPSQTPGFLSADAYREPEDWEKCILSLEKGEWTEEMAHKDCFKRWKKERPAMPSAYFKSAPQLPTS